jgi:hypothetical protein
MCELSDFNLSRLIADFGCRHMIETGAGDGRAIAEAVKHDFAQIYCIEKAHKYALDVALRFAADPKVTVIHARAEKGYREAFEEIPPNSPVLFALGAHAPDTDICRATQEGSVAADFRLPLEKELRFLAQTRDLSRDLFLIADLRVYEDGAFAAGPCRPEARPAPAWRSLRFVDDILGATHQIDRLTIRTGFLCAFPRLA